MKGTHPPRERFPRTALRLAAQTLFLALVVCAAAGSFAWLQVRATLEADLREELGRTRLVVLRAIEALRQDVEDGLARAEKSLIADASAMESVLVESGDLGEAAVRHRGVLELFEITDEDGTVRSSAHEPANVDLPAERLQAVQDGAPVLLDDPSDPAGPLVMAGRRVFPYSRRKLAIRGGLPLDERFFGRIAPATHALLIRSGAGAPVIASPEAEPLAAAASEWASALVAQGGPLAVDDPQGTSWLVDFVPLGTDAAGQPLARVVVAVDHSRIARLLASMTRSYALFGSVIGVLAALAGVAIARGVARPVDDVIRAFDAIADGRADYTFDVRSRDAMQELPAAFSRTHRALELQRRRSAAAERVAAWREVAQHLAHEVKNPLVPIRLTVENLTQARRLAPERFDRMFDDGMRTILEEVQQLSRIVSEFTEFARLPLPAPRPTDLGRLVDRAIELHASEPGLHIERRIEADLPRVPVDPDLVSRALKNIVGNAVDAVREGASRSGIEPRIEIRARSADGMAEIEVADNGPGLSDESARHIFEPYFTTKPDGTGLGMTLTYRIIVDHGGTIVAENREGGGARVIIRLPLRGEAAGPRPGTARPTDDHGAHRRRRAQHPLEPRPTRSSSRGTRRSKRRTAPRPSRPSSAGRRPRFSTCRCPRSTVSALLEAPARAWLARAGDRPHGARHDRERGRGGAPRRVRLHREAAGRASEILLAVTNALRQGHLEEENRELRERSELRDRRCSASSPPMRELRRQIRPRRADARRAC